MEVRFGVVFGLGELFVDSDEAVGGWLAGALGGFVDDEEVVVAWLEGETFD